MVHILLNPLSNNKKAVESEKVLTEIFKDREIQIEDITKIKNLKDVCSSYPEGDEIVIAGGDGTLTNFANDVYELHLKQKIFYYPCGSGNDFYNDIKDSGPYENNLVPMNEFLESLPVVHVNGMTRYFINGIGYGLDGYCCEEGDRVRAETTDKVNYTKIAIKGLLGKYKPRNAVVTIDGSVKEYKKVWLAPSMIGRFYGGGMMIAPQQNRLNKEKVLTNVIFSKAGILKTLIIFPTVFTGKHTKYSNIIEITEGHNVTVKFDIPCALQIDGETVLNVSEYSVSYGA